MRRSFRSPKKQAEKAVSRVLALGKPRHGNREDGRIHSLGTARAYQQHLKQTAQWLQTNGHMAGLNHMTTDQAQAYLEFRAQSVGQKTLDLDRQAIRILPSVNRDALVRVHTQVNSSAKNSLAKISRIYTEAQRGLVYESLTPREQLTAEIIHSAGLRAVEILTIRPVVEQPASTHRTWSKDRFYGREEFARYTVIGKGGLIREIAIPPVLAEKLEAQRRETPVTRIDRVVRYQSHYNLPGGTHLTSAWSKASKFELGWSSGIHGLRHYVPFLIMSTKMKDPAGMIYKAGGFSTRMPWLSFRRRWGIFGRISQKCICGNDDAKCNCFTVSTRQRLRE